MGIKSPTTFGDYYWSKQVEAANFADEQIESAFAPYFAGVLSEIPYLDAVPSRMQALIRSLADPPSAGFGGFALGVGVEMVDETLHSLMAPAMKMMSRSINRRAKETWLTSSEVNTLFRRGKIRKDLWGLTVASEGYEDVLSKFLYQSQMPYPTIPELITYARYHGEPDNPWSEVQKYFDIDATDWPVWKWLGLQRLSTLDVQTLRRRGLIDDVKLFEQLSQIGWSSEDRPLVAEMGWLIPNAMLMVQGDLQQGKETDQLLSDISIADINPKYAQTYLDAILTKPASSDIVAYNLRKDPKLSGLETQLRQIGIHPDYLDVYRTLAYPIPPVADIITMAVREAFTPAVAARFGQYEDFPKDFEKYAAMKGLSSEWAQRYWAAHWSLPSPQQGYEMLHRGIINQDDLLMLMKALDIMPFWRDKLMQMSFRRLTRVDIRRMYKAGVITEPEVYENYLQHGYNPKNAKLMTNFTVQWALPAHHSITRNDILTAYKNRMITRIEASDLLADMGETYFHRDFMLKAVDYKKGLELTENKIKGIRNLYKRQVYDENKTIDELSKLDLPTEEITDLMQIWYYEIKAEPPRHWTTAQTLGFVKAGLITKDRSITELKAIGYDAEHIDVYMRSIE